MNHRVSMTGGMSTYVTAEAKAQGIVGYSDRVVKCPTTGKPTNCYYRTPAGRLVVAYDQAAADATDNAVEGKEVQS